MMMDYAIIIIIIAIVKIPLLLLDAIIVYSYI